MSVHMSDMTDGAIKDLFAKLSDEQMQKVFAGCTDLNIEREPDGLDQHVAGAKLDAGKIRAGLVLGDFSLALTEVCKVGTYGAKKYTPHGWLSVTDGVERYTDAMIRHWLAEFSGEKIDRETGLYHAAHLAWNAMARLELMLRADSI